jgi:hypothetical protein
MMHPRFRMRVAVPAVTSLLQFAGHALALGAGEENLVFNPGFEIGAYSCGMFCSGLCNVPGWSTSQSEFLGNAGTNVLANSGSFALDLNTCSTGWAYQDVPCVVGRTYSLTFALGASWPGTPTWCGNSPAEKRIRLTIGTASEELGVIATGSAPPGRSVQYFLVERNFVATTSVVRVRFDSLVPGCSGAMLDDVSIIPEPAIPTCADADLLLDRVVNGADLGILLAQWGPNTQYTISDINRDGVVDGIDLGLLLALWGPCP